ncbi:MAG TPA: ABC transporter substrate-binding protein [Pseudonocardiaceae bacterium]|jgi:4,5-dihydroxyphthalate decarboxylase|nr:ABC transporter substrate-binding protein [Pseudonocardiaceae bacterium]
MSSRISLTLSCWDYDRTQALADGRVRPEGVDLTYLSLPVEETFFRMMRHHEFDVAEMSLSSYVISLSQGAPFIAIPVFPSRSFRHNGIYVNANSGIEKPSDLVGKVVGVPEYQVTAAVWIRGILEDHYGVPVDSVRYRTGGLHDPGRVEKAALNTPASVEIKPIDPTATLSDMLVTGEIDAMYSPRSPRPFLEHDERVRWLFPDPRAEEEKFFTETGIFPIMHTVVLRREVYEQRPWLAQTLYKAFVAAKTAAVRRLAETAAPFSMIPWSYSEFERVQQLMGPDFWPYGLPDNEKNLAAFLRYSYSQGLAQSQLQPSDLFAPETLDTVKV